LDDGLRSTSDTILLRSLARTAGVVRHPAILSAALAVVADSRNAVPARAAGLLILAGQLGGSPRIAGLSTPNELTVALPATGLCGPALIPTPGHEPAAAPLPADAARQVAHVVDAFRVLTSQPTLLRNLARCIRPTIGGSVPPQIDISAVTLEYVRCNQFVITNPTVFSLPMSIEVDGTTERRGFSAAPGRTVINTELTGPVRLRYDGKVIGPLANGGVA
jgi:hypothetical protein